MGIDRFTAYWELPGLVDDAIQNRELTADEWRRVYRHLLEFRRIGIYARPWNRESTERAIYTITRAVVLAWFREMVCRVRRGVCLEPPGDEELELAQSVFRQAWERYREPVSQEFYECRLVLERIAPLLGINTET